MKPLTSRQSGQRLVLRRLVAALGIVVLGSFIARTAAAGQNQWSSAGPEGGMISSVAVAGTAPAATVYAGTRGGGVFKTTDGGASWTRASDGLADLFVSSLSRNPAAPGTLYAGTEGGGVFKTTDGGASWVKAGLDNVNVQAILVHPAAPATVYAGP